MIYSIQLLFIYVKTLQLRGQLQTKHKYAERHKITYK
jgi:hypothetical protein